MRTIETGGGVIQIPIEAELNAERQTIDVPARISKLAFKLRFTQKERIDIRIAAKTIPQVYDFEDLINSSDSFDLSQPEIVTVVMSIEPLVPLANGRAREILETPLSEHEKYRG